MQFTTTDQELKKLVGGDIAIVDMLKVAFNNKSRMILNNKAWWIKWVGDETLLLLNWIISTWVICAIPECRMQNMMWNYDHNISSKECQYVGK